MGIFGRKVKLDADGPAPEMDPPHPNHTPSGGVPVVTQPTGSGPVQQPSKSQASVPAVPVAAPVTQSGAVRVTPYGVEDAIKLMRTLAGEANADLVVRVVKRTLESLNVQVADIVVDAERKETAIKADIATYKADIAELDHEIKTRRDEITRLEAELTETSMVKTRLTSAGSTSAKIVID